jgi:alpha-tubulin suppressor-like RCC1 family protein
VNLNDQRLTILQKGQLLSSDTTTVQSPIALNMTGFRGKTVIKIAGAAITLMALTSDGTVFTAGSNANGVSIHNSS